MIAVAGCRGAIPAPVLPACRKRAITAKYRQFCGRQDAALYTAHPAGPFQHKAAGAVWRLR